MRFFIPIIPPTATSQQKGVTVRNAQPHFYHKANVLAAKQTLTAHLAQHRPCKPLEGPLQLIQKWIWPPLKRQKDATVYKATRPDCSNIVKLLEDCMTDLRFWEDDAQVASLVVEKFRGSTPGIYIEINQLPDTPKPQQATGDKTE